MYNNSRGRAARSPSPAQGRARSRSRSALRNTSMKIHDEHGNMIDDGVVTNFISSIDSLPTEEWRARTMAFESLIESLPKPNDPPTYIGSGITPWYKSHAAVRRLLSPISSLLLDARSTVAKHTCQHLAFLVGRIKVLNPPNSDTCKYLLKDLLPTILALHSQTVKVIRGYASEMMNIVIPLCRFKSGLPVLLERLRKDKARDVREACVKYLKLVIRHWARDIGDQVTASSEVDENNQKQEYLTPSICLHIGNGLARALMDPAQSVRMEARNSFEIFRFKYPDIWNDIVQKKDGILSKDKRLKKSILNAAIKADAEGRSDLSNYYPSYDEGEDYDGKSIHSSGSKASWHSRESFTSSRGPGPKRSNSASRQRSAGSGLSAPPKRNPINGAATGNNLPPHSRSTRINNSYHSSNVQVSKSSTSTNVSGNDNAPKSPSALSDDAQSPIDFTKESRNPSSAIGNDSSRSSPGSDLHNENGAKPNENYNVANQLLAAHKSYIDELMESLRTEMNTVREFEAMLVQSKSSITADGYFGPSEDEVLKYFETVYGFLEKGTGNGNKLREAMENVSRTDIQ